MTDPRIDRLDDAAVLRLLSQVTDDLRENLPRAETAKIASEQQAREAVSALLELGGVPSKTIESGALTAGEGRALLLVMLQDAGSRAAVENALANPPGDDQKSVELALAGAVILGALITWLQTSIEFEVNTKDGKREIHFKLKKDAADKGVITDTAKTVSKLLGA